MLRSSTALMLALLLAGPVHAACKRSGVRLFPLPGSVIPTNGKMLLEGQGAEQARVSALVGHQLILRSDDDDLVGISVERGWTSAVNRVAVVLRPTRTLHANRRYTLLLENALPQFELLHDDAAAEPVWKTGASTDETVPLWLEKPAISEGEYVAKGPEVTRNVKLRLALKEESPVYLVVSIRRARGPATPQSYFVPVFAGEAVIGHDGCGGGFSFEDGRAYQASVEAFDAAGNRAAVLPSIEFHAPKPARQ